MVKSFGILLLLCSISHYTSDVKNNDVKNNDVKNNDVKNNGIRNKDVRNKGVKNNQDDLVRHLLANSSNVVRPVKNKEDNVTVTLGLELIQLITLQETEQSLTCKFWIRLMWKNELMKWNQSEWSGTEHIHISPHLVWTPDIMLYNSLEDGLGKDTEEFVTPVTMFPDGKHVWLAPVTFKSSCHINVANFPFDDQKCLLKLGSWTLNSKKLSLNSENKPIITSNYVKSPEWDITSLSNVKNTVEYKIAGTVYGYDDVTLQINISRKSLGYLFYMVTPCLLLVVTTLFSFSLPPESKAKVVVIITNLLAFFVFLTMTNEILPRGSDVMPTISVFYLVLMIECVATLLMACSVMTAYHYGTQLHPPEIPGVLRNIIEITCSVLSRQNPFESSVAVRPALSHIGETIQLITLAIHGETTGSMSNINQRPLLNKQYASHMNIYSQSKEMYDSDEKLRDEQLLKSIHSEIHFLTESKKELDVWTRLVNDWKYLAHVMDRVYYWVFIFCSTLSSAYILGSAYLTRIKYNGNS